MRFERGHKDATRDRILDVAAKRFRENGIAATGIASIMEAAGLTNGAFYAHFESKEHLTREVMLRILDQRKSELETLIQNGASAEDGLKAYLSETHRDHPGSGCGSAALASEIARHSTDTKEAYTAKLKEMISLMASQLPGDVPGSHSDALALYAMMIGSLQLSRAVSDEHLSRKILESALHASAKITGP